jgi:hypothetical protein
MGIVSDLLSLVRDAVRVTGQVEALRSEVAELSREQRQIDRRLVRVETLISLARQQRALERPRGDSPPGHEPG